MPQPAPAQESWKPGPVIDWLLSEGRRQPDLERTVALLGHRMVEAGAPVSRLRLSMRTLHPMISAYSAIWEPGQETAEVLKAPHGLESRPAYKGSPMQIINETGKPYRKRLIDGLTPKDPAVLREFRDRGATDYYGVPLHYLDNLGGIVVFLSDAPGGFSDHDIAGLTRVAHALAPLGEVSNNRQISRAVADSYLGPRSGKRVMEGGITRGHVEKIEAAVLVSDIRDWTGLSNRLAAEDALHLVNRYFELIDQCVSRFGGEILKFVGDGVLAVFAVGENGATPQQACQNALSASRRALDAIDETEGLEDVAIGIGLHFGKVLYGNIGSETRLDFTVLGQAVNMTARIEGLCSALDCPLLFSEAFSEHIGEPVETVATRTLKGFDGTHAVLTLNR